MSGIVLRNARSRLFFAGFQQSHSEASTQITHLYFANFETGADRCAAAWMIGLSQQSLGVGPGRVGGIVDFEIVSEAMFYVWKKASRASLRGEYFLDRRRNTKAWSGREAVLNAYSPATRAVAF